MGQHRGRDIVLVECPRVPLSGGPSTRDQQSEPVADLFRIVRQITDPLDELVPEHHGDRRHALFLRQRQGPKVER